MPKAEEMRARMVRYLEAVAAQDVDAVVALCADSVSVEDPVGGPAGHPRRGAGGSAPFFRGGFRLESSASPGARGPL